MYIRFDPLGTWSSAYGQVTSMKCGDIMGLDRHSDTSELCELELWCIEPTVSPRPGFFEIMCTKFGDPWVQL